MASPRFRDTGRFVRHPAPIKMLRPANLAELMRCLDLETRVPGPVRVRGAGSAPTDCNTSSSGTILDMTGLDRIVHIDAHNQTVTAEAGVRLGALVSALAEEGLELFGNHDQMERTLGGAVASPCMGAGIGCEAAHLSSQVLSLKVVTASGKLMKVSRQQRHLLSAFRVYLDLRRYEKSTENSYDTPWKLKDWGESTVLPHVFKSLNRVLPIPSVKYRLMDNITTATHDLVNSRLVRNGNNATATGAQRRRWGRRPSHSSRS